MVYVLGRLKVKDFNEWQPVFDERSSIRKEAGSKVAHVFRNRDDLNEIVILFEWDTKENALKYFEADIVEKILKKEGAKIMDTTFLDEVEITI